MAVRLVRAALEQHAKREPQEPPLQDANPRACTPIPHPTDTMPTAQVPLSTPLNSRPPPVPSSDSNQRLGHPRGF
jgi:hypothetical protein